MPITALPTPPSRNDPANFAERGDAFLAALPTFVAEANALESNVNQKEASVTQAAQTATTSANTATTKAGEASTSAQTATAKAGEASASAGTAAIKAAEAAASAAAIDPATLVRNTGNETIGGVKTFSSGIVVPSLNGGPLAGMRNRVINGNFDIWQRGPNVTISLAGGNAYGYAAADRWWGQVFSGSSGTGTPGFQCSQQAFAPGQTAVPNEPKFFHRFQVTALGTQGGAGGIIRIMQKVESVRTFAGKQVTVGFWAKADSARTYALALNQYSGTGGITAWGNLVGIVTFNVTTVWQFYTFTFNVPSLAGKSVGTNGDDYFSVEFVLYKQDNTVYSDTLGVVGGYTTGAYLDLAQVQAEAGSVATAFEVRDYGDELRRCQRYYEMSGNSVIWSGYMTSGNTAYHHAPFKVTKRANPVVTTAIVGAVSFPASAPSITGTNVSEFIAYLTGNNTSGSAYFQYSWTASAEL